MSTRPNITIHVIPTHAQSDPAGAFQLLRSADGSTTASQHTWHSAYYYDTPDAVAGYTHLMATQREHALDQERSRALLRAVSSG